MNDQPYQWKHGGGRDRMLGMSYPRNDPRARYCCSVTKVDDNTRQRKAPGIEDASCLPFKRPGFGKEMSEWIEIRKCPWGRVCVGGHAGCGDSMLDDFSA